MSGNNYEPKKYYAIAIDPIHVGSGGSLLGRVDLPIIKEAGTNLPKIPGTSLSGPARANTAIVMNKYRWKDGNGKEYSCAGRGGEAGEKHCGSPHPACPVCIPYGFSKGSGNSMQGLVQFFDAHILLFPVASIAGPVWVTSPMALEGLGLQTESQAPDVDFHPLGKQLQKKERLNFGWLMLNKSNGQGNENNLPSEIPDNIKQRAVLVSDSLFSSIVNSNLEVRTSVSIDPATGAAEERALFTYEALPRGTVFKFDILYNSGDSFRIGGKELKTECNGDVGTAWVKTQVEKGLKLFAILGIGGMNTRGMGRIKVLNFET
ncbi:MAG: type III-B CRISPR module RAMP protein Cmr4 [Candidatus Fischerbacteria bacterium RBG_13_37_8]|uniref:Type III-B CRISPR module RAMP protein Cmr4 n=1 Tax=Candidatus Fischerbacteria bacterium RBG_13_37_8 TaxID=1817863 RepID=A0A1F5VYF2_9BACT|nr:MAG: type III-B CRISPR module RAMP protein Cmr4 [Candidatus Fischerbacteria bacterium RBG_13_37_8]